MEQAFKKFVTLDDHDIAIDVNQIVAIKELESNVKDWKFSSLLILRGNIEIPIKGGLSDTYEVLGPQVSEVSNHAVFMHFWQVR